MTEPGEDARDIGQRSGENEELEFHCMLDQLPPDHQICPGVTVSEFRAFHGRPATPPGAVFESDIVFATAGAGRRPLLAHVYRRADLSEQRPVVVLVHGGGWSGGHPFQHVRAAAALAGLGYVTAMVSYRRASEAQWPAALADVASAIRWMRESSTLLGADSGRVIVAGDSAGGHLALMTALVPERSAGEDGATQSARPEGLVLWYPIVDLTAGARHLALHELAVPFLGGDDPALLADASPLHHASATCPPTLLQVGADDPLTTPASISALHARLALRGVDATLHVEPDAGHCFDVHPDRWGASLERVVEFITERWPP